MDTYNNIDKQVKEIVTRIPDEAKGIGWSEERWSREIKGRLGKLGQSKGFYVCASQCKNRIEGNGLFKAISSASSSFKGYKDKYLDFLESFLSLIIGVS